MRSLTEERTRYMLNYKRSQNLKRYKWRAVNVQGGDKQKEGDSVIQGFPYHLKIKGQSINFHIPDPTSHCHLRH